MRSLGAALLLAVLVFPGAGVASHDEALQTGFAPRELLVRFDASAANRARADALADLGAQVLDHGPGGVVQVALPAGSSVEGAAAALERRAGVRWAEPNYTYRISATPDDTDYSQLWGLSRIHAPEAWDLSTGSASMTVAVVDTGVDWSHPDLAANLWTNTGETPADGLDNDGNGFVDDVRGWNFGGAPHPTNDPDDTNGHGTHVAGTIGAVGNNATGVTGVNWNVKVMPVRAGDDTLTDFDIANAFDYACENGAKVVNGSFGGYQHSDAILDAVNRCPNTLFVFAAGNDANNNDLLPVYPCTDPAPNIVCVAATNSADNRASFSNYGATSVDIAAPGEVIHSTYFGPPYADLSGTSMATPHVAGAAALVWAHRPALTVAELKRNLINSVDQVPALNHLVVANGRLNVFRAMTQEIAPPTGLAITAATPTPGVWTNSPTVSVSWGGAVDAESGVDGYSFAVSPDATMVPDEIKDGNVTSLTVNVPDGTHWFHVRARDGVGNWSATVHAGPFRVDSFPPARPTLSSPSHRPGFASTNHSVGVSWITLGDSLSGLDGFSYAWGKQSLVAVDQVKDAEETANHVTSAKLAAGAWWFGIRARDNAGNWTDPTVIGPFVITNAAVNCSVPRLRGLALAAAKKQLVKRGCALGKVKRAYSSRVKRGRVVAQRPTPGLRLRRGAKVAVTISRGKRPRAHR
jgi:subtilisin family serine protease